MGKWRKDWMRTHDNLMKAQKVMDGMEFVDRQSLKYGINLVESKYIEQYTEAVFNFVYAIAKDGAEIIFRKALKDGCFGLLKKIGNSDSVYMEEFQSLNSYLSNAGIIKILKNNILPLLKEKHEKCEKQTLTDRRIKNLRKTFKLSEADGAVIGYLYCSRNSVLLERLHDALSFGKKIILVNNLGKVLGFHGSIVQKAFTERLSKYGLVDLENHCSILPDWVDEYLSNLKKTLHEEFFVRFKGKTLDLEAHLIDKPEAEVLQDFISQNRPVNLLFYGEPGTGKTEMAKSLASFFNKELLIINNLKNVKPEELKTALIATTNIADTKTSLILIDEADGFLNSSMSFFFTGEKGQKSWINDFMDQNKHKIIWVTNRSEHIESSTMRRFSFSLKFKPFTLRKKLKVFDYCLKQYGHENLFSEEDLIKICRRYTVNASGISDTLKSLKIGRKPDKIRILEKMETILKNHQTAITGIEYKSNRLKEMGDYSLKALNTSENLDLVIKSLRDFQVICEDYKGKRPSNINVLLYGFPGTGKTEFVKYLGNTLQKEVLVKRASDLLSCYWGESEKLIAKAFEESEGNESILFLDEADSFLRSRESTQHSWENSQINELLTQMENYKGILICSTNYIKGLDLASLRRFKFKIEFKPLNPDGVLEMYQTLLTHLVVNENITTIETRELTRLAGLTPGDFHVVAEKYCFADSTSLSHRILIESLKSELKLKPKNQSIGFVV